MKVYKIADSSLDSLTFKNENNERFALVQKSAVVGRGNRREDWESKTIYFNLRELLVLHQAISDCIINKEIK